MEMRSEQKWIDAIESGSYQPKESIFLHGLAELLGDVDFSSVSVLDAGCGTGKYAAHLVGSAHRYVALDRSLGMLRRAKERFPQSLAASVTNLPFRNEQFDAVLSLMVLMLLPDPELETALTEHARVLKPGGTLYLAIKDPLADRWCHERNHYSPRTIPPQTITQRAWRFNLSDGNHFWQTYVERPWEYYEKALAAFRIDTTSQPLLEETEDGRYARHEFLFARCVKQWPR